MLSPIPPFWSFNNLEVLTERSLWARPPSLEGSKTYLHPSALERAPHATPQVFPISEVSWHACFRWGQPGCRRDAVVVVWPCSHLAVAGHVVMTSVELSTLFVITRWALLLLKLQHLLYHLAWKWKVILLVEGVETVGHESDIRKTKQNKKNQEPSVLGDPQKKKYPQTNKNCVMFCYR